MIRYSHAAELGNQSTINETLFNFEAVNYSSEARSSAAERRKDDRGTHTCLRLLGIAWGHGKKALPRGRASRGHNYFNFLVAAMEMLGSFGYFFFFRFFFAFGTEITVGLMSLLYV
jgi:hypothetical protein